jgi:RNA ligase
MFPIIKHIDDVRPHVDAHSDSFYIADKGDYLVANYASVMSAFPPLSDGPHAAILRECRGLIFDAKSGNLIRRPLHKFFNLGEREESRGDNFKSEDIVGVYDKLDGSMIAPFMLNGEIRWGTKMGLTHMTPDVEDFVRRNPKYHELAKYMLNNKYPATPIFEYMAPKHRIVVNHEEEKMALLAVRFIETGEYLMFANDSWCRFHQGVVDLGEKYDVPVVRRWEVDTQHSLVDHVRELEGSEGVVVELRNGDRLKIKSLWYVDLHKNREAIAKEKYVVGLILNERIDDAIGLVPDFVVPKLEAYTQAFVKAYEAKLEESANYILEALATYEAKRDFAIATAAEGNHLARTIAFKVYDLRPDHPHLMIADMFKERILAFTDKSDTDFQKQCREAVFNNNLPAWNIWDNTASIDE